MQFLRRCVGEANRFWGGFKFAEKGLGVNCNVRRPSRTVHKWADVSGLCGLLSSSSRLSFIGNPFACFVQRNVASQAINPRRQVFGPVGRKGRNAYGAGYTPHTLPEST